MKLIKIINCLLISSLILVGCSTTAQPKLQLSPQEKVSTMLAHAGIYQVAMATCLSNNNFSNFDECTSGKNDIPETFYNDIGSISTSDQNVIINFNDDKGFPNNGMVILTLQRQNNDLITWKCAVLDSSKEQINLTLFPKYLRCNEITGFNYTK